MRCVCCAYSHAVGVDFDNIFFESVECFSELHHALIRDLVRRITVPSTLVIMSILDPKVVAFPRISDFNYFQLPTDFYKIFISGKPFQSVNA